MSEPKGGNQWGSQQAKGKAMRRNEGKGKRRGRSEGGPWRHSNNGQGGWGSIARMGVLARTKGAEAAGLRVLGGRRGGVPKNDGPAVLPFGARPLLPIFVEFAALPYP